MPSLVPGGLRGGEAAQAGSGLAPGSPTCAPRNPVLYSSRRVLGPRKLASPPAAEGLVRVWNMLTCALAG